MIVKLSGNLDEKRSNSLIIDVQGIFYEVFVPLSVLQRIEDVIDRDGNVNLIIYHYFQIGPAAGVPILIGFLNEIERDFFLQFIKVSGIGPRAAVKALNKPISQIASAIEGGNDKYLKTLPGIGSQKAKEIIAKLQGKIGKYGLIQDKGIKEAAPRETPGWQEEALEVLLQLQYKRQEAKDMVQKALERSEEINSAEELLNEIYKQRVKT